jgi:hypothetical protein
MLRFILALSVLGLLLFVIALALPYRENVVRIVVPDKYVGPITVLFDQPDGARLDQRGEVTTFVFPPSGVLRIREGMDQVPNSYVPESFDYSGHRLNNGFFPSGFGKKTAKESKIRMAYLATAVNNDKWVGFAGTQEEVDRAVRADKTDPWDPKAYR